MAKKPKKLSTDATSVQHICDTDATSVRHIRYLYAPLLGKFRANLNKNVADMPQTWLPMEVSLLIRYEFCTLSTHTRYIFVAILLYCAARGTDEIPVDTAFLANALAVDARTIQKSISELENSKLLLERKKERSPEKEIEKDTDRQKESVSVDDSNSFQNEDAKRENENGLLKNGSSPETSNGKSKHSQFSIEECLKYVEVCQSKGDKIENARALASHLHKSGEADAFIMATLYPVQQETLDREKFGAPIKFTNQPCSVCFGAKMADTDGKGYRACEHCKNERNKSTGFEPQGEK